MLCHLALVYLQFKRVRYTWIMSSHWKNIIYGVGIYSVIVIGINLLGHIPVSGLYEIIASIIGAVATVVGIFISQKLQDISVQKLANRPILEKFHLSSVILKDEDNSNLNIPTYQLKFPYESIFLSFVNGGAEIYNIFFTIKINDVEDWINLINIGENITYLTPKSDNRVKFLSTEKRSDKFDEFIDTHINILTNNIGKSIAISIPMSSQGVHSYAERQEVYHLPISRAQFILVQLIIENMAMRHWDEELSILKDLFEVNMVFEDKLGNKHEEKYSYSLQVKFLHLTTSNPDIECEIRFIPSSLVAR